jgi:Pyruvate/2-oxoglutarate dehydrogenase complex, dihydrolipoamide dehydrogenase (E3) component, and related enzymes
MHLNLGEWNELIERSLADPDSEPLLNLERDEDAVYDAVFIGGGAGGRFGAAYMKAMGGRPLIIDAWPFLGGSCPHQACVPHHLFSEAAEELDRARWFSDELFYPKFDASRASILEMVKLFLAGRGSAHAFMNWQTKEQLDVEYVLNARATIVDKNTVQAAGRTFKAKNLVLGMGARPIDIDIPGLNKKGVLDFVSLVEELDYEPTRCVIIGGSKVAMEYGSFFHATGCDTTIVSRSPLMRTKALHHVDEDLRQYVVGGMRKRGMEILEGAHPVSVNGEDRVESVTGPAGVGRGDRHPHRLRVHGHRRAPEHHGGAGGARRRGRPDRPGGREQADADQRARRLRDRRHDRRPDGDVQGSQVGGDRRAQHHGRGPGVRLLRVPGLPAHHLRGHLGRAHRGGGQGRPRRGDHHPDAAVRRRAWTRRTCRCRAPRARCSTRSASRS